MYKDLESFIDKVLNKYAPSYINFFYPNGYSFDLKQFFEIVVPIKKKFDGRTKININVPFGFKYQNAPLPQNEVEKLFTGCSGFKSKIEIYKTGDVYPCCLFFENKNYVAGNILDNSIKDIINSKKYNEIKENLRLKGKKESTLCQECKYVSICDVCPASVISGKQKTCCD